MTMLDKISLLMKKNGLNKRQLAIECNLSYGAVDGFFKVSYENMKLSTFIKLCDRFGVTMDSMAYDDREIEYRVDAESDFNKKLVEAYLSHPEGQQAVCKLLDLKQDEQSDNSNLQDVPELTGAPIQNIKAEMLA
jgi:transcriptional regulator with XRE-family HTH domain